MSVPLGVRGARASLGGSEVLRGVDLSLGEGEYLVVLGPSGSGKTTLLRAIAGFLPLDAGAIEIGGEAASDPDVRIPPERRRVGMVFQSLALWPHLTVLRHLDFVFRAGGVPAGERRRRAASLLELVRLSDKGSRVPSELSGGEGQRLALARALAGDPRILLLDEPLGAVDEALRSDLAAELRDLQRRSGLPTIHVTHDQEEGLALADRVAVLRAGRIEQVGTPEEIFRAPATPFVAAFVGRHNLLPGVVEGGVVRTPLGPVPSPPGAAGRVTVAVRPDAVAIGDQGAAAEVASCAFAAGRWLHRLLLDGLEVRAVGPRPAAPGARVRLAIAGEALVLPAQP
ncbi:MAG TPA: ABC transporter ATP-binding protein [Planctomycetota bacterium]|nr:ABC transporter ATP-binding protein [Planctomycetota bacterium]